VLATNWEEGLVRDTLAFSDIRTRDRFFYTLRGFGYDTGKNQEGNPSGYGRISNSDGTAVHYELDYGVVRLNYDGSKGDLPSILRAIASELGAKVD
jgi:hypothetical protein